MQKQKKILFLHGFYASGSCVPALALKEAFNKKATVLTPDLPLHPADAVRLIRDICDQEKPDVRLPARAYRQPSVQVTKS